MVAALQMYSGPSTDGACTRFWSAWAGRMRAGGLDAPAELTRGSNSETIWTDPDMFVSQTCGYPYVKKLRDKVRLIATPHYGVEGCDGPNYSSWVVVHASNPATRIEELRGSRAAYNGTGSQSGYNSFRAIIAPVAGGNAFFSEALASGGHQSSMQMIVDGKADCATVDAVSWAVAVREDTALGRELKHIAATPSLPGLPFITSACRSGDEVAGMRDALFETLADPALADDLQTLMITGATVLDDASYQPCLDMEAAAISAGYPALA